MKIWSFFLSSIKIPLKPNPRCCNTYLKIPKCNLWNIRAPPSFQFWTIMCLVIWLLCIVLYHLFFRNKPLVSYIRFYQKHYTLSILTKLHRTGNFELGFPIQCNLYKILYEWFISTKLALFDIIGYFCTIPGGREPSWKLICPQIEPHMDPMRNH